MSAVPPERVSRPLDLAASTELWLVRHAESQGNAAGLLQGQADLPLSPTGERQAQLLAQRLRGTRFGAVLSSDLRRAVHTACIVAEPLGLPVTVDARLREVDVGAWSGLTTAQIAERFPDEWADWQRRRDPDHRRGGGESYRDLQARIVAALDELTQAHCGERVLVVTHGGSIGSYLTHLLGVPVEQLWRLSTANTALTRVQPLVGADKGEGVRTGRLALFNDCGHLDAVEWA